jgi:hypothetical protein
MISNPLRFRSCLRLLLCYGYLPELEFMQAELNFRISAPMRGAHKTSEPSVAPAPQVQR